MQAFFLLIVIVECDRDLAIEAQFLYIANERNPEETEKPIVEFAAQCQDATTANEIDKILWRILYPSCYHLNAVVIVENKFFLTVAIGGAHLGIAKDIEECGLH